MDHTLSEADLRTLRRLRDDFEGQGGWATCRTNPPSEHLQSLVERGYCRLSSARTGPLGLYTGEVMASLTEAARMALPGIEASIAARVATTS